MRTRIASAAFVAFVTVLSGCNGTSPPTPAGAAPSWTKGNVDGVSYEVRGQGESSSFVSEGYREFRAGANKVRVQGGRVTANGKEHGAVKSGDTVLLDTDGTLTVNGVKR